MKNYNHNPHPPLSDNDVILAGTLNHDPKRFMRTLNGYRDIGALVILFGSKASSVCEATDILIDNAMPVGTNPVIEVTCRGMRV